MIRLHALAIVLLGGLVACTRAPQPRLDYVLPVTAIHHVRMIDCKPGTRPPKCRTYQIDYVDGAEMAVVNPGRR